MSGKWTSTCQTCGLILPAQAQRCSRCGAPVIASDVAGKMPGFPSIEPLQLTSLDGAASPLFLAGEQQAERPFNVVLSLAPELDEEPGSSPADEAPLSSAYQEVLPSAPMASTPEEVSLLADDPAEMMPATTDALLLPLPAPAEGEPAHLVDNRRHEVVGRKGAHQTRREVMRFLWLSPRLIWATALALALIFGLLFFFARSTVSGGIIAPDWGLASLRIGLVAALLCIPAIILSAVLWRARAQPGLLRIGVFTLVLIVIGGVGLLSAAPLHRLQGQWFEARGQYGLALGAYQLSGDSVATNQNMARIAVEWAEQLSAEQRYGDAVAALQPVVEASALDGTLAARADKDMVAAYLAWGDQAQQQQAFRVALERYQALDQAAYCDGSCQAQVHAQSAQALLGLAQQLTAGQQYDQAVATYQQLINGYGDTPEGQEAQAALTAPQPIKGRLLYSDKSPATNFQVLTASQWAFDTGAQVFTLEGQQYQARTDANGAFSIPSVAVGKTYMIAWIDANGHSGTCLTTNNQPLYTVHPQPLRETDAGVIDVECAQA